MEGVEVTTDVDNGALHEVFDSGESYETGENKQMRTERLETYIHQG